MGGQKKLGEVWYLIPDTRWEKTLPPPISTERRCWSACFTNKINRKTLSWVSSSPLREEGRRKYCCLRSYNYSEGPLVSLDFPHMYIQLIIAQHLFRCYCTSSFDFKDRKGIQIIASIREDARNCACQNVSRWENNSRCFLCYLAFQTWEILVTWRHIKYMFCFCFFKHTLADICKEPCWGTSLEEN